MLLPMTELRAENKILLCVAHRCLDNEQTSALSGLLQNSLNWSYLLALAEQHSLIPLLSQHLNAYESLVPKQVMAQLTQANRENTATALFLTGELVKLLALFESHNIAAIPFKGPVLGISAYGDPALRQFGDLDLLVRKKDLPKIRALLTNHHFQTVPLLNEKQQAAVARFECAWNFENGSGAIVDIHWDVIDRYLSIRTAETFWQDLETVTIGGRAYPTLSAESLLLVLCLHGFTHRWDRVAWLCDVASVIESRPTIDWQKIIANATRLGVRRIFALGLKLANELLGTQLPDDVSDLMDKQAVEMAAEVRKFLFAEPGSFGLLNETFFFVKMRERRSDRIRSALSLITVPRKFDWMYVSLPPSLLSLYYPLRPFRLAAKYSTALLRGRQKK